VWGKRNTCLSLYTNSVVNTAGSYLKVFLPTLKEVSSSLINLDWGVTILETLNTQEMFFIFLFFVEWVSPSPLSLLAGI
jgi:hypothetical protein